MDKTENALTYFRNKFNCSQSVFTVFGTDSGLPENDCLKISCAFGGGMGRLQKTCGAVTGALMVLGLKFGKGIDDPEEKKAFTYLKTREFIDEFTRLNGSVNCRELLNGLDMNDPADKKKIAELNLFTVNCEKYVGDAVRIVEKLTNG
jgi:C_GCAxxG_C_C family probable redox protein